MRIKRLGVLSLARVLGMVGLLYGALVGLVYGYLIGFTGLSFWLGSGVAEKDAFAWAGAVVGGFLVGFAVLGAVLGFLHGLFGALFMNLVFRVTGGLVVEVERDYPELPGGPARAVAA
jgi:hypothetical protein